MHTQLYALLRECFGLTHYGRSGEHANGSNKNDSLKRLNDLRLKQLSFGLIQPQKSQEQSVLLNHWTAQDPTYTPPAPAAPTDSWNRLEAFIISRQLETPLVVSGEWDRLD